MTDAQIGLILITVTLISLIIYITGNYWLCATILLTKQLMSLAYSFIEAAKEIKSQNNK